jgi:hypothetical protein
MNKMRMMGLKKMAMKPVGISMSKITIEKPASSVSKIPKIGKKIEGY